MSRPSKPPQTDLEEPASSEQVNQLSRATSSIVEALGSFMARPKRVRTIFQPFVLVLAAVYFAIDALALSSLKPLLRKSANLKLFNFIARWITSLGPYATLSLFMVPLILLEPVKPFSAYLVASGQFKFGMLVLIVGEILKITVVERIFHIGRDKLMKIKAFAWVYNYASGWLTWLQALPSWQAVKPAFDDFIHWARKLNHDARARGFR